MGPSNFLEDYKLSRLPKKLQYANFKRKVADDEIEPDVILKRYRTEFPNDKISDNLLQWVHAGDTHMLYDTTLHKPRFMVSDSIRPIMIGEDNAVKKFNYKQETWTPHSLPTLCNGALLSIFKHMNGWDLVQCRLVSKKWARLIEAEQGLWKLDRLPSFADKYHASGTSAFRRYIFHMFLNATDAQIIRFLYKKPELFHFIACLYTGKGVHHVQIKQGKGRLRVGRYMLINHPERPELRCDNTKLISAQLFLDAYRQYLSE